ncbi:MAG TPA: NAD(P)H-hydrate dehydratase [Methanomicrobia archaeon]|nr:NAD(P)H-hydrate dehydratase [Methanomicrobia archaeon]
MNDAEAITAEEMAALDENCGYFGLIPLQLMENAGAQLAAEIRKRFPNGRNSVGETVKVTMLAGKGNNGGDAFVAARQLHGFAVTVLLLGRAQDLRTAEARHNWHILLQESGVKTVEITDSAQLKAAAADVLDSAVLVDGIFGTGITGAIREPEATAIELINNARPRAFVVAVDVPSGLDPTTGEAGSAVTADLTVTFHRAKTGLLETRAAPFVGELVVADISIPENFERLAGPGDVRSLLKRSPHSHKGDNGRVLIVGGGPFSGAPSLAALAALRAGADWVTVAAPRSVSGIIASFSPNLIVHPLSAAVLVEEDVLPIVHLVKNHDIVAIGMGLGAAEETQTAVQRIIEDETTKKLVVDADGFYGLELPNTAADKRIIVTPHAGEFAKLGTQAEGRDLVVPPEDEQAARIDFVTAFSRQNNVVTLMKGPTDIVSDGARVRLNRTGNAGMTVGGTGDVLAGLAAAFFALTHDPFTAATAAAFVNGTAGDIAFEAKGYGLLATDVLEAITRVTKQFS